MIQEQDEVVVSQHEMNRLLLEPIPFGSPSPDLIKLLEFIDQASLMMSGFHEPHRKVG